MAGRSEELAKLQVGLELNDQNFTKALGNVSKQSKGLARDFDVASRSIDNAENKMEAYANAIDKGNKAIETNNQKLQMQTQRYDNLFQKTQKQKQQYDELKEKLKEQERALSSLANTEGKSSNAYKEQEKAINDLKKALQDKLDLVQKNSNKLQGYSTDIDRTTNDLDRLRNAVRDTSQAMEQSNSDMVMDGAEEGAGNLSLFGKATEFIGEKLGGLAGLAKGAGAALVALVGKGAIEGAESYDNAITDLRINLGLTKNEAKTFYSEIGKAADGGYTFEGITSSLELLSQRFNLSGERSKELARSLDILNRLGIENTDAVTFMTAAYANLGMTQEESLDMIMAGQQQGLNMSGDWLDTLMEYSPEFDKLGNKGQNAFALIKEAMDAGVKDSDSAIDAIKEFFLLFEEGGSGTKDTFSTLGLDFDTLKAKVKDGSLSNIDFFQLVNEALAGVSDETERAALKTQIYGGTGEKITDATISAWGDTKLAIEDTTGAMENAKDAQEESYAAMQQDLSNEWNNLKETIGVGVIPILKAVVEDISGIINAFSQIPANTSAFANAMSSAFSVGMATMDNAFLKFKSSFLDGSAGLASSMAGFTKSLGLDGMSKSFSDQASKLKSDSANVAKEIEKNNGIIEKSGSKVKDFFGKLGSDGVKVKTDIDTSKTDKGLDKVKKSADEVNGKTAKVKATADTAGASKNITGLKKNVDDYNKKASSVKTTKFKTDTTSASKNVTGLKTNVSDYDKKNTGKTKSTKFQAETAGASKNVTGLKNNISNFVSRFVKTFTTTFKVVTKYSTSGTPTKQSSGAKTTGAGAVSKNTIVPTVNTVSNPITPMSSTPSPAPMSTGATTVDYTIAPMSTGATSSNDINIGSIMPSMNLNVDMLRGMESELKKINNQLDILDKKSQDAFGNEKINYLNKQNELYRQQQALQHEIAESMRKQQNELRYTLSQKGFYFNSNGTVTNDSEKLLDMERYVKYLEERVNADKEGNNEALKNQYESAKEQLAQTKQYLDEYIDLTDNGIPNCSSQWLELQEKIEDTNVAISKSSEEFLSLIKNIDKFSNNISALQNEAKFLDIYIERAFGDEKQDLIEKRTESLRKQQAELHNLANTYREQAAALAGSTDPDQINEYNNLVNDKIPSLGLAWWDLEKDIEDSQAAATKAIEDASREQLNKVKQIEDKITDIYKDEIEDRKDLLNEELREKLKLLDKEKDAYNKIRQEINYKDDLKEQQDAISELQKKIDSASRDTSLSGQARLKDLVDEMKDQQKKLEEMVQQNIDEQVSGMYDSEKDRLSEDAERSIKDLENKFSDSNIAEYVNKALGDGVFTDIDGNVRNLKDTMMEFLDESGEAFGVLGNVIKNDLNSNLQQALDTFKNLDSVYGGLNIKVPSVDYSSQRYNPSASNNTTNNTTSTQNVTVQFNQPLVQVQGNVTEDVMPGLKKMIKEAEKEITNNIVKSIK
jgi:phage-related minor tail protein